MGVAWLCSVTTKRRTSTMSSPLTSSPSPLADWNEQLLRAIDVRSGTPIDDAVSRDASLAPRQAFNAHAISTQTSAELILGLCRDICGCKEGSSFLCVTTGPVRRPLCGFGWDRPPVEMEEAQIEVSTGCVAAGHRLLALNVDRAPGNGIREAAVQ